MFQLKLCECVPRFMIFFQVIKNYPGLPELLYIQPSVTWGEMLVTSQHMHFEEEWRGVPKRRKNNHNCCGFVPISVSNHTPHQYTPMLVHLYHPPFIFRAWGGMKSSIQNHAPGGNTSSSVPKNNDCCKHFIASSGGELWSCITIWPEENLWHLLSIMFLF